MNKMLLNNFRCTYSCKFIYFRIGLSAAQALQPFLSQNNTGQTNHASEEANQSSDDNDAANQNLDDIDDHSPSVERKITSSNQNEPLLNDHNMDETSATKQTDDNAMGFEAVHEERQSEEEMEVGKNDNFTTENNCSISESLQTQPDSKTGSKEEDGIDDDLLGEEDFIYGTEYVESDSDDDEISFPKSKKAENKLPKKSLQDADIKDINDSDKTPTASTSGYIPMNKSLANKKPKEKPSETFPSGNSRRSKRIIKTHDVDATDANKDGKNDTFMLSGSHPGEETENTKANKAPESTDKFIDEQRGEAPNKNDMDDNSPNINTVNDEAPNRNAVDEEAHNMNAMNDGAPNRNSVIYQAFYNNPADEDVWVIGENRPVRTANTAAINQVFHSMRGTTTEVRRINLNAEVNQESDTSDSSSDSTIDRRRYNRRHSRSHSRSGHRRNSRSRSRSYSRSDDRRYYRSHSRSRSRSYCIRDSRNRSRSDSRINYRRDSRSHSRSRSRSNSRRDYRRDSRSYSRRRSRSNSRRDCRRDSRSHSRSPSRNHSRRDYRRVYRRNIGSRSRRDSRRRSRSDSRINYRHVYRRDRRSRSRSHSRRDYRRVCRRESRSRSRSYCIRDSRNRSRSRSHSRMNYRRDSRSRSRSRSISVSRINYRRDSRNRGRSKGKRRKDYRSHSRSRSGSDSRNISRRESRMEFRSGSISRSRNISRGEYRSHSRSGRRSGSRSDSRMDSKNLSRNESRFDSGRDYRRDSSSDSTHTRLSDDDQEPEIEPHRINGPVPPDRENLDRQDENEDDNIDEYAYNEDITVLMVRKSNTDQKYQVTREAVSYYDNSLVMETNTSMEGEITIICSDGSILGPAQSTLTGIIPNVFNISGLQWRADQIDTNITTQIGRDVVVMTRDGMGWNRDHCMIVVDTTNGQKSIIVVESQPDREASFMGSLKDIACNCVPVITDAGSASSSRNVGSFLVNQQPSTESTSTTASAQKGKKNVKHCTCDANKGSSDKNTLTLRRSARRKSSLNLTGDSQKMKCTTVYCDKCGKCKDKQDSAKPNKPLPKVNSEVASEEKPLLRNKTPSSTTDKGARKEDADALHSEPKPSRKSRRNVRKSDSDVLHKQNIQNVNKSASETKLKRSRRDFKSPDQLDKGENIEPSTKETANKSANQNTVKRLSYPLRNRINQHTDSPDNSSQSEKKSDAKSSQPYQDDSDWNKPGCSHDNQPSSKSHSLQNVNNILYSESMLDTKKLENSLNKLANRPKPSTSQAIQTTESKQQDRTAASLTTIEQNIGDIEVPPVIDIDRPNDEGYRTDMTFKPEVLEKLRGWKTFSGCCCNRKRLRLCSSKGLLIVVSPFPPEPPPMYSPAVEHSPWVDDNEAGPSAGPSGK